MDEQAQTLEGGRRRSHAEAEQLVAEYEASGLTRVEFCRKRGLSLATLVRYRKRQAQGPTAPGGRWVEVEVSGAAENGTRSGLVVIVRGGHCIEVGRGFDTHTLVALLGVLGRR